MLPLWAWCGNPGLVGLPRWSGLCPAEVGWAGLGRVVRAWLALVWVGGAGPGVGNCWCRGIAPLLLVARRWVQLGEGGGVRGVGARYW